jgi:hypothetical protein
VEEAGVLVPLKDIAKFSMLLPMSSPIQNEGRQRIPVENTELKFPGREITSFFKHIKQVNQEYAIIF